MPTFVIETIEGLPPHPEEPFFKLIMDGKCFFDDFWEEMEAAGNQQKALDKIQAIILLIAKGSDVPKTWFQALKHRGKDDPYPDFEIRSKQLRVYLFEDEEEGKILVLGEIKKSAKKQSKTIAKLREIKLAYFASKS